MGPYLSVAKLAGYFLESKTGKKLIAPKPTPFG